jgi:hypothetical protein
MPVPIGSRRRPHPLLGVVVGACFLLACREAVTPSGVEVPLPTVFVVEGQPCVFLSFEGVLRGDPEADRVAWLDLRNDRWEVVWPSGYRARFAPQLQILDPGRRVVIEEGGAVTSACAVADPDTVLLRVPFN